MHIGETIKKIRLKTGLTQIDFAKEMSTSQATICRLEKNFYRPSTKLAKKIIKFARNHKIKVSFTDIFPEE